MQLDLEDESHILFVLYALSDIVCGLPLCPQTVSACTVCREMRKGPSADNPPPPPNPSRPPLPGQLPPTQDCTSQHSECTCTGAYMRQQGPGPGPTPSPQQQMGVSPQHQMAGSPQRQPLGRQQPRDRTGTLMRPQQHTGHT